MLSAGIPAANATYTLTDLQTIEQMILNAEWNALQKYVEGRPDLLLGDDPLAVELRTYLSRYREGFLFQLFISPDASGSGILAELVAQY